MTLQPTTAVRPSPTPGELLAQQLARLEANPDDVLAWRIAARAMCDLGRLEEAVAAQRQAVARAPNDPDLWVDLGGMLAVRGVRDEPEACYRRAIAVAPDHAEARARLGLMRLRHGDVAEAGACFAAVLADAPDHPGAVAGAALVLDRKGHADDAWRLLHRSKARPTTALALATATVARHVGAPARALPIVRATRKSARGSDLSLLLHAEGDLYDAVGDAERAWKAWSLANQSRNLSFDPAAHLRAVDTIIRLTARLPAPSGPDDERPVFIVGMPRSGSTLVETQLDALPGVTGAGELEALRDLAVQLPRAIGRGRTYLEHVADLGAYGPALGAAYLEAIDAVAPGAERVIDKMPNNALHLALVGVALPGARIIWCERNDDDVLLSCFQQSLSPGLAWATTVEGIRAWQEGLRRLKAHWRATLPNPIHTVRYEALVAEPERVSRELAAFIGRPWDASMLRFHERRRQVATASWDQVTEPLHARRVGRSADYQRFFCG